MLAILTTHPIQYQVPLWRALARDGRVPFEVWYLCDHAVRATHDPEFGKSFAWDLGQGSLEGYPYRFLKINERWSLHPSDFFGIRLRESLVPLLREKGVTALWIQGWQKVAYWQAVAQAKRAGVEVWLRGETNDLAPAGGVLKRAAKHARLRWLVSRVDRFLCIGTANRRFYLKHGVPASKLHWAPYCVDNARFTAQAAALRDQRWGIRRDWGIPDDAFCVLFCGKFIPKKRPLDLVAAAQLLATGIGNQELGIGSEPDSPSPIPNPKSRALRALHLLFVGSGELGAALRAATTVVFDAEAGGLRSAPQLSPLNPQPSATSSQLSATTSHLSPLTSQPPATTSQLPPPSASFAGFMNQTDISRAYVAADVLVLPSDHGETWGLVVNEAMVSGLPCIVSDAVGCGEDLVAPVDPALRFPLGDVMALERAIVRVSRKVDAAAASLRRISEFDLTMTVEAVACLTTALSDHAAGLAATRN